MDDLYHHLLRFHGSEDILSHGLVFHAVAEFFCDFVAYVGVEESLSDILNGFSYIDFGYFSFTLEYLE